MAAISFQLEYNIIPVFKISVKCGIVMNITRCSRRKNVSAYVYANRACKTILNIEITSNSISKLQFVYFLELFIILF